jgi:hypothetical protein
MFSSVNGGCSWISSSGTSRGGPSLMFSIILTSIFFSVDGGHSRISSPPPTGAPLQLPRKKFKKDARKKDVGPTYELATSPEVGQGATIGTLRIGYPSIQASR